MIEKMEEQKIIHYVVYAPVPKVFPVILLIDSTTHLYHGVCHILVSIDVFSGGSITAKINVTGFFS